MIKETVTVEQITEASKSVAVGSQRLKSIELEMSDLRKRECAARNDLNTAISTLERMNKLFLDESDPERLRKSFAVTKTA